MSDERQRAIEGQADWTDDRWLQTAFVRLYATFLRCGWHEDSDKDRELLIPMFDHIKCAIAARMKAQCPSEARPGGGSRACIPGERCPHVDGADRCRLPAGHELTGWYDGHEFEQRTPEAVPCPLCGRRG